MLKWCVKMGKLNLVSWISAPGPVIMLQTLLGVTHNLLGPTTVNLSFPGAQTRYAPKNTPFCTILFGNHTYLEETVYTVAQEGLHKDMPCSIVAAEITGNKLTLLQLNDGISVFLNTM